MILNPYASAINAYVLLAGQRPGSGSYADHKSYIDANGQAAYVQALEGLLASTSNASMGASVLTGLGLSSVFTAAQAEAYFAANAGNRVQAALNLADSLSGYAGEDAALLAAKTSFNETIASAYTYASNPNNTADVAISVTPIGGGTGQTFTLTTNTDTLSGTSGNDTYTASVSATSTKQTYDAADMILDTSATDADVLNVNASQDVTTAATVTGIETVNFILDALSSGGAATPAVTQFDVAATNIAKGTKLTFDNVATTTIVNKLAVTGDKGGAREVSTDFSDVTTDAAAAVSYDLKAAGTIGAPVKFTASANAKEVTLTAAGYLDITAGSVDTLVNATSTKDMTITDAGDAAAVIANSGGKLTVTDAAKATVVRLVSVGDITVATSGLAEALAPIFVSGGTVTTPLTAATHVDVTAVKTATITETGNALVSANLTGRGEKTTFDFTGAGNVLANVTLNGDQDIVLNLDASNVDNLTSDVINISDASTGSLTVKLSTAAGAVDLSKQDIDLVDLAVSNAAKAVTVKSGQDVKISIDQAGDGSFTAAAATASTNTLNVTLDDGTRSASTTAVDLTAFAVSNFASVVIDASKDSLQSGAAETHDITKFLTNGADVTINAGANNIGFKGALTLGATSTLTITGSGKVTGNGSEAITAKVIDASAVTGIVTLNEITSDEVSTVKTGSANDVVETTADAATAGDLTINTGAGNDKLTLHAAATKGESLTIDMGDGTDTLVFADDQAITRTGTDLNTVTGVEKLEHVGAYTVDSSVINNATWDVKQTTSNADSYTVTVLTGDTAINLSGLTVTTANAAELAGDTFVVDASAAGNETVTSITGATFAKNTLKANATTGATLTGGDKDDALTGGGGNDTIVGGAGADTITGGKGTNTITGGAGVDVLVVGAGVDTVTDFTVGASGDTVTFSLAGVEALTTMDLVNLDDSASASSSDAIVFTKTTGVLDLVSAVTDSNVLVLHGSNVANASALETALEAGGAYELTHNSTTVTAGDGFIVIYGDGTNTHIATVEFSVTAVDNATVAAGTLTAKDFVTLTGIADPNTVLVGQFNAIAA